MFVITLLLHHIYAYMGTPMVQIWVYIKEGTQKETYGTNHMGHTCMHINVYAQTYVRTYVYIHAHTQRYIHTYKYIHKHTYEICVDTYT
jgi:hypothetical protein